MNKESLASRRQRSTTICAYVFLIPVIVLMAVFLFYPIVQTFINSFTSWNGISANKSFNGIYNWNKLLHDADFWKAFFNNIKIMILSLVIQMPIGILLATFLDTGGRKYNFFKVICSTMFLRQTAESSAEFPSCSAAVWLTFSEARPTHCTR